MAEGWKSLAVRDEIYDALEARARKENRSITNCADNLLRQSLRLEVPA